VTSKIRKSIPFSPSIKSTLGKLPDPGSTGRANIALAFEIFPVPVDIIIYNNAIIFDAVVPNVFTLRTDKGINEALPIFTKVTVLF